jgi:hypothetical protein
MANRFHFKQDSMNKSKASEKILIQDETHSDECRTEFQVEFDSKKLRLEVLLPTQLIIPVFSLVKKLAIPILAGSYLALVNLNPHLLHHPAPLLPPSVQVTPQPK